jgi:hypothetical protein
MDYGIVVVACLASGACNMNAPLMGTETTPAAACSAERKTDVLNGIGALVGNDLANVGNLTRADQNALFPITEALRARRVDRLLLRCVEWPAPTRRGRTVGEDAYSRAQIDQLLAARTRR